MQPHPLAFSALSLALASALSFNARAQDAADAAGQERVTASSTSNTTAAYDTKRTRDLDKVKVTGTRDAYILGGGNMTVQTAAKSISTVTRDAIEKASGGSNFTQLIDSIPGIDASTSDVTGLANGNYSLRGFDSSSIGITVNGAPITDSGSYSVYATEYGDAENYNDITVTQGTPNVDQPEMGATGGQIAWSSIDPTHKAGVDFTQSFGSNDYQRSFARFNTGDTGPVRSWLSFSRNTADKWKGRGDMTVNKVDGKSVWDISPGNSISASFQYNRQMNYSYNTASKAQIASDYETDYVDDWTGSGSTNYYKLRRNPYSSVMVSLDGEFTLSDTLRLSVVPYLWWGKGGGSSGASISSTTLTGNVFGYSPDDVGKAYSYSYSSTLRPGVVAKFNQDVGTDHNLVYGVWIDRSRKSQNSSYVKVDQATGEACDLWADSDDCFVTYPDGTTQQSYRTYTQTLVQKYFLQDNWTPTDQLTVTLGASYLRATRKGHNYQWPGADTLSNGTACDPSVDTAKCELALQFDNTYSKFLPAFGLKYQLDDRNQLYYGVAKTMRIPATNSITLNTSASQVIPDPETAVTHDLGWRYYGDAFSAAVALYQSDYRNKQMSSYDNDLALTTYVSIPSVRMRGINGEASYQFSDSWKLYGSYTHTEAQVRSEFLDTGDDGIFPMKGRQLANTPKDVASLILSYDADGFWAQLKGKYSGARYADYMNTERAGGYTSFSFSSGYSFADWRWLKKPSVKLNVSNLTDKKAITWVSSTALLATSGADQYDGSLYDSVPYYSVLQGRSVGVTIGGSF